MIIHKVQKIILRFCLLFYGFALIFAGCSWADDDEKNAHSMGALGGNRVVLGFFYMVHARLPYSLAELKSYCQTQKEMDYMHYHKSYDDAVSGNTVSYMGFFPETIVRYGAFFSNFVEFRTPLIYDFSSTAYLRDKDWIIMAFYIPSTTEQMAITFDGSKEIPFIPRKFPTNKFMQMLKKQNLVTSDPKISNIDTIRIIVFLLPAIVWGLLKIVCRKFKNEDGV